MNPGVSSATSASPPSSRMKEDLDLKYSENDVMRVFGFTQHETKEIFEIFDKYVNPPGLPKNLPTVKAINQFLEYAAQLEPSRENKNFYDPLICASDSYQFIAESDQYRLIQIRIKPEDESQIHSHHLNSVILELEPSEVEYYSVANGKTMFLGNSSLNSTTEPRVKKGWGEFPHFLKNVNKEKPYYALRLERKASKTA